MATTTAEKITYKHALEAVKLYQSRMQTLQPIDDPNYVWERCVEDTAKPPEPGYQLNDPVYVDGEYGIYMRISDINYHAVMTKGTIKTVTIDHLRPAPYRIRLRESVHAQKTVTVEPVVVFSNDVILAKDAKVAWIEVEEE